VFLPAELFATHIVVQKVTHEAMRGPSAWSVGDRELMAAYVSKMNECEFCVKAHTAVAVRAYHGEGKVSEALSDLETTVIEEPLRATLRLLGKLTASTSWMPTTCSRCWPRVSHANGSRTRSRCA
jgi:AhpD family alkylhydroperoxidase